MAEYNDCVSRAQRLSVARESFLAGDSLSVASVRVDDLFIYLRWLVAHLATVRHFHQYLKVTVTAASVTALIFCLTSIYSGRIICERESCKLCLPFLMLVFLFLLRKDA